MTAKPKRVRNPWLECRPCHESGGRPDHNDSYTQATTRATALIAM